MRMLTTANVADDNTANYYFLFSTTYLHSRKSEWKMQIQFAPRKKIEFFDGAKG